jgi:hypothetical protein
MDDLTAAMLTLVIILILPVVLLGLVIRKTWEDWPESLSLAPREVSSELVLPCSDIHHG